MRMNAVRFNNTIPTGFFQVFQTHGQGNRELRSRYGKMSNPVMQRVRQSSLKTRYLDYWTLTESGLSQEMDECSSQKSQQVEQGRTQNAYHFASTMKRR